MLVPRACVLAVLPRTITLCNQAEIVRGTRHKRATPLPTAAQPRSRPSRRAIVDRPGKTAKQHSATVVMHRGPGIAELGAQRERDVQLCEKLLTQSCALRFVPVVGAGDVSAGRGSEREATAHRTLVLRLVSSPQ